jgi:hypothetical protein
VSLGVKRPSLSAARSHISYKAFCYLLEEVSLEKKGRSADKWKGHIVRAIDGSWLTLPASKEILASFPRRELGKGFAHYPNGLLVTAQNVFTAQPVAALLSDYHGSERTQLALLAQNFSKGDISLLDRGLGGFAVWQYLFDLGQNFVNRINVTGTNVPHEIRDFIRSQKSSAIVTLYPKYRAEITVRLLRYKQKDRNGDPIILATSLFDARKYKDKEILKLFQMRWRIETLFYRVKELLKVENFHARSVNGILQEIYAQFFILSLLARLTLEAIKLKALDSQRRAPNLKNAVEILKRYLGFFISSIARKARRRKIILKILTLISSTHCEKQKGRKNPRISKQPTPQWNQRRPLGKNRTYAKKVNKRKTKPY